jgi:hypothetical protein
MVLHPSQSNDALPRAPLRRHNEGRHHEGILERDFQTPSEVEYEHYPAYYDDDGGMEWNEYDNGAFDPNPSTRY